MINTSRIIKFLSLSLAAAGIVIVCGYFQDAAAQSRDPFSKPGWARAKDVRAGVAGVAGRRGSGSPLDPGMPAIEQRIEFYKRQREAAAANGQPVPKVTSVLTLNELAVTGIFRTPRGYAAMVEAVPIKLSYTIYPGEKFFDGQLVAVEENRLVFRRVVKTGKNKFVASVENKPLRQYTDREVVQGTAPTEGRPPEQSASTVLPAADGSVTKAPVGPIVSPLEEMNKQVPTPAKAKSKSDAKKPVKVANNN